MASVLGELPGWWEANQALYRGIEAVCRETQEDLRERERTGLVHREEMTHTDQARREK